MNGKSAKKLRRLARAIKPAATQEEQEKVYKRLKAVHKENIKNK